MFGSPVVTGYLIRVPSQAAAGFSGYNGPAGTAVRAGRWPVPYFGPSRVGS